MADYVYATSDAALLELKNGLANGKYTTVDSLMALLKNVSGEVPNATSETIYYLYGGKMPEGTTLPVELVNQIVKKAPGKAVSIAESQASKFAVSNDFGTALVKAVSNEMFHSKPENLTPEQAQSVNEKLVLINNGKAGGDSVFGQRVSANSVWDYVSEAYVRDAKGNFRYLGHTADEMSIFVQRELPAVLAHTRSGYLLSCLLHSVRLVCSPGSLFAKPCDEEIDKNADLGRKIGALRVDGKYVRSGQGPVFQYGQQTA